MDVPETTPGQGHVPSDGAAGAPLAATRHAEPVEASLPDTRAPSGIREGFFAPLRMTGVAAAAEGEMAAAARRGVATDAARRAAVVSRRGFLKVVAATVVGALTASGCRPEPAPATLPASVAATTPLQAQPQPYAHVPVAPETPPRPGQWRFFSAHEAATVEAMTARILPGTPDDPGAREAGVATFIDFMLSHPDGFAESVYRSGPWAEVYEGEEPPAAQADPPEAIWVAADEIERYGYQSHLTPREVYRIGLAGVDRYANGQFGADFADLGEEEQDVVVEAMAEGEADGFEPFSGEAFFQVLRQHTVLGMFSDPAYGGNRDLVGWRLIGYPGAQRAYSESEIVTEGTGREPWSLADLPHFNYSLPSQQQPYPSVASPAAGPPPADREFWQRGHTHEPVREDPLQQAELASRHSH